MHPGDTLRVCKSINRVTAEKSKCFIFKVHSHLRDVNDKAYDPAIIAIGPYHRDKDNTKMMEEHKLRYLQSLVRQQKVNIAVLVSAIGLMEQEARKCYAEPICLDAAQFTEMLVLDGCFVIELVRKFNMDLWEENKNDPIFHWGWMINSLMHDLILFENQIPFSVLCKLFDLMNFPDNQNLLIHWVLMFFKGIFPGKGCRLSVDKSSNDIKHLLKFLDSLINSSVDVEILCLHGIIDNWRGDTKMVSNMFNKLDQFVTFSLPEQFMYSRIFESLNAHCEQRRNRWLAKLKQHHLNSPWAIMSIVAALLLLLLTAIQTVCSVLQLV